MAFAGEGFPLALSLEERVVGALWLIGLWEVKPVCCICSVIVVPHDTQLDVVSLFALAYGVEDVRGGLCRFRRLGLGSLVVVNIVL